MKKKAPLILLTLLMLVLSACSGTPATESNTQTNTAASNVTVQDSTSQAVDSTPVSADFDDDDFESAANEAAIAITLNGDSISAGEGVSVNGGIATITAAGTYEVTGTLNNGQLIVETEDEENVTLLLAGANIHNESGPAIYVANAEKVIITLVESTENILSDGAIFINLNESGEPNAAIFSHDDLTINGEGVLSVIANYNNGIASKDDLKITGGNITVTAVNDGLKGKDSVSVKDGIITLNVGGDGIQSTNVDESEEGFIAIEGGIFNINATDDALNAATSLVIDGGNLTLNAGDDGIHAEYTLIINGGDVNVQQAFEGLESAVITINGGKVYVTSSDDGLNATTGAGGGQNDGSYFYMNGGSLFLNTSGDGLDSNGTAIINGGIVVVQGPTMNNNGPLDVNGELEINGGTLIVSGSAGMPEMPSTNSAQNSIAVTLDTAQPGGTIIHLENAAGESVLTYESPKDFQLFVFSSPELQLNTTYTLYVGGSATGTVINGVYTDGDYTPGTQIATLETTSNVTTSGNFESGRGGGREGKGPGN